MKKQPERHGPGCFCPTLSRFRWNGAGIPALPAHFFSGRGNASPRWCVECGRSLVHLADVVRDFKRSLKPDLYGRLVEHSFYYGPPYLPLFQFEEQLRRPLTSLTLMDWEDNSIREGFAKFMGKYYPDNELPEIWAAIEKYIKHLRNSLSQ